MGDPAYVPKQSTAPAPRPKVVAPPPKPKQPADDLVRDGAAFEPEADANASVDSVASVPWVHHGAVCDATPAAPGCFLSADGDTARRGRLIEDYKHRVAAAEARYDSALLSLELDARLQKDDSDLPWILELIFDVVGAHALSAALSTSAKLAAADEGMLRRLILSDPAIDRVATRVAGELQPALAAVEAPALEHLAKMAVGSGKSRAIGSVKSALAAQKRGEKGRTLDYITRLQDESSAVFESLREMVPGAATDAELVVYWQAFARERSSREQYVEALRDKLDRFKHSGVERLGRDREWRTGDAGASESVVRDRKLVRVEYASGYPPRFAYARTDWFMNTSNTTPSQRDYHPHTLPIAPDLKADHPDTEIALLNDKPEIEQLVDPEFAPVARERHLQLWGAPPVTVFVDDSAYVWEPARAERAQANLRKGRSP